LSFRNIKIILEYDGTHFCGWQIQKKGISIQGLLQETLKRITGEKLHVIASGRTDAGVHAFAQVAHFKTSSHLSLEKLKSALNALLPPTVVVKKIEETSPDFHAQLDATRKLYAYLILNDSTPSAFIHRYSWQIARPLDWDAIHRALELFVGRHDFKSFQSAGTPVKSTVREIYWVGIQRLSETPLSLHSLVLRSPSPSTGEGWGEGGLYALLLEANGFLKQMVRNIVGTVVQVGQGRLKVSDVKKILEIKDRRKAGPTAPAKGLFLVKVEY
jgi:tRNA pseudouridine38-40 synthase